VIRSNPTMLLKTHLPLPIIFWRSMMTLGMILMTMQSVQAGPSGSSRMHHSDDCNTEELRQVAHAHARSFDMRFVAREVNCDQDWAVLAGDLEDPHAPAGGPQGVGTTLIFHREGSRWKHKDASSVCGTLNPENPEARPKDAKIPQPQVPQFAA
jgi:hypothetical protein